MAIRKRTWVSGGKEKTAWVFDYLGNDLDENGKRKRHIIQRPTKREAEAERDRIRPEISQGTHVHPRAGMTVLQAAEEWLRQCEAGRDGEHPVEPHTLRQYEQHVEHLKPLIGGEKISQLTKPRLMKLRDDLLAKAQLERPQRAGAPEKKPQAMPKVSRSTARKVLSSFKSILLVGGASASVMHAARQIKIKVDEGRHGTMVEIPEPGDITKILAAATERAESTNKWISKTWRRWRALLYTAAMTGMRQSELRGLTWEHVDFKTGVIRVRQRADEKGNIGKVKSESAIRDIPLSGTLATVLKAWKLACPTGDLCFPNWQGKVESGANIHTRCWAPALDRAKVGRIKFHSLRHFHASHLIADGANPKEVQVELGHSSIQVTYDLYGKLFKADMPARRRRADRMAESLVSA